VADTDTASPITDAWVLVPRAALEHILDWHNKTPCGVGQESLDEVVFDALHGALFREEEDVD
jgi:hypothetical protein